MENFLFKLTRPEVEDYLKRCDVVLLPVGSTEQHGKHLPLDNDSFTSLEVSRRIAEKTGVLVAPVIPVGFSPHHMNFKGSITLTFDTLLRVYKEVIRSLLHHGFKKIVVVNGHGGNTNVIAEATRQIREETGVVVYTISAWASLRGFGADGAAVLRQEGGGHACEMETSVELYIGQRVLMEKAEKWAPPKSQSEFARKYAGKAQAPRLFDEITEIGSLGDPTIATREKGEAMVEAHVRDAAAFIEDLKRL